LPPSFSLQDIFCRECLAYCGWQYVWAAQKSPDPDPNPNLCPPCSRRTSFAVSAWPTAAGSTCRPQRSRRSTRRARSSWVGVARVCAGLGSWIRRLEGGAGLLRRSRSAEKEPVSRREEREPTLGGDGAGVIQRRAMSSCEEGGSMLSHPLQRPEGLVCLPVLPPYCAIFYVCAEHVPDGAVPDPPYTHARTRTRTHARSHTHIHAHTHIHTHKRMHARTHARTRTHTCTHKYMHTHTRTHTLMRTHTQSARASWTMTRPCAAAPPRPMRCVACRVHFCGLCIWNGGNTLRGSGGCPRKSASR